MATAASSLAAFQELDVRADGASRHVAVDGRRVSIARRFQGIDMRLAVPVAAYEGVVLRSHGGARGGAVFEVCLAHRDPDLSVTLCEAEDGVDGASAVRTWARFLDLPALEAEESGAASSDRRKRGIAADRRPRFLTRRRTGDAARLQIVHREDELIAYE